MKKSNGVVKGSRGSKEKALLKQLSEGVLGRLELRSLLFRSNKYDDLIHPKIVFRICSQLGAAHDDISEVLGVSVETIHRWCRIHPRFEKALRLGRDIFDTHVVEKKLLQKALGYTTKIKKVTVKTSVVRDKDGMPVTVNGKPITFNERQVQIEDVHHAPDSKSIIFWLCNRNRERWERPNTPKQLQIHQHQHAHIDMSNLSDDELKNLKQLSDKAKKKLPGMPLTISERNEMIEVIPDIITEAIEKDAQNYS